MNMLNDLSSHVALQHDLKYSKTLTKGKFK